MSDRSKALTLQFLAWIAETPRTYADTMDRLEGQNRAGITASCGANAIGEKERRGQASETRTRH